MGERFETAASRSARAVDATLDPVYGSPLCRPHRRIINRETNNYHRIQEEGNNAKQRAKYEYNRASRMLAREQRRAAYLPAGRIEELKEIRDAAQRRIDRYNGIASAAALEETDLRKGVMNLFKKEWQDDGHLNAIGFAVKLAGNNMATALTGALPTTDILFGFSHR